MSNVHYFQRYSQPENVVTNNTLLLLSRIYHYSPSSFGRLLQAVLDDIDVSIGPSFSQQEGGRSPGGRGSVPDGTIAQPSFRVVVETKLYDNAHVGQLVRHLDRFQDAETQVLLLVAPERPGDDLIARVGSAIEERGEARGGRAVFRTLTFSDLIGAARDVIPPHAAEMVEMLDDYEGFCTTAGLIPSAPYKMRVVQCAQTLEENVEHGVYYHPASRSYSDLGYLGLYTGKSVRAVGKVTNTVRAVVTEAGDVEVSDADRAPTEAELQRIAAAALDGKRNHGYDLDEDRLYFLVDCFYRTDEDGPGFNKTTKYGIPGEKHFDLRDVLARAELPSAAEVAAALAAESWE